ncbi:MAG: NapC/NirT family cytochrome c [Planctomycetes bacterium]|nr:NapC/NirT family cytochrome c [Planctomycetota bacterium]
MVEPGISPEAPPHSSGAPTASVALWDNLLSLLGFFVIATSILLLVTFALFVAVSPGTNPYVDVIGYLVIPGLLIVGLGLVPLGMVIKYWRVRRRRGGRMVAVHLRIDLTDRGQRRTAIAFLSITFFIMLPLVGVSSYHGYHYTDSTEFCAQVCHAVMEPQGTAYAHSPHARVTCAECHIGSGASWFVKSKLSGTRQVFAVMQDTYPRPIPPAITELRPARETCEQCHWPAKFFGSQLKTIVHFSPDEKNTRREVRMLVKTGGADRSIGRVEGIHMHMALSGRIEYIATDDRLQEIPWVRYVTDAGDELIYRSDGRPSSDPRPEGILRGIDCMDCHNRAAHLFYSPNRAVDLFLSVGRIDPALPFVKREAVAALTQDYASSAAAEAGIAEWMASFYRGNYPALWESQQPAIQRAIDALGEAYRRSVFPHMKVDWRTYPDNIGHLTSPGCLRCHDGRHVNQLGQAISSDCNTCHTFLNPLGEGETAYQEGPFVHSMDLNAHRHLRCDQCHTGGTLPLCRDCHESGAWLEDRGRQSFVPRAE